MSDVTRWKLMSGSMMDTNDDASNWVMYLDYKELESQLAAARERADRNANGAIIADAILMAMPIAQYHPLPGVADPTKQLALDWIANVKADIKQLRERAERAEKLVAACRAAGFVGENGEVRRVLGTLPLTADGVIAGTDAVMYLDSGKDVQHYCVVSEIPAPIEYDPCWEVSECYSTKEAARQSAAKGGE